MQAECGYIERGIPMFSSISEYEAVICAAGNLGLDSTYCPIGASRDLGGTSIIFLYMLTAEKYGITLAQSICIIRTMKPPIG